MEKHFQKRWLFLLSEEGIVHVEEREWQAEEEQRAPLKLPEASPVKRRLYGYLVKHRKIAPEIVDYFVQKKFVV